MKTLLTTLAITLLAVPAFAVLGLPYAEDAMTQQGEMRITGGITLESDLNLYGARFSYGIMDGFSVFAGAGLFDPDLGDSELYLQGGGKYTLPLDLPVDLAIRASLGYMSGDWFDLMTINGGVLASTAVNPMITVYGFGGLSHWRISPDRGSDNTENELALAGGAIFNLNENVSFFAELAHIDEMFISLGARYTL